MNALSPSIRVEHIGNATLYCGDCRDILQSISCDSLITDPPYGVNLGSHLGAKDGRRDHVLVKSAYATYDDTPENFSAVVAPAIVAALSRTKRGLVFCAGHQLWSLPRADVVGGVYIPAAQGRNKWGYASLAHCLLYGQAPDLNLGAKHTCYRSTESAPAVDHPCPKPDGWMAWAVDLASRRGEIVLDPFMGSGSTGIACSRLGRGFVGIEIDPAYFAIACRRIEDAQRQGDLLNSLPPAEDPADVRMRDLFREPMED